jgi:DNA end-binding protein Ku
MAVRLIDSMTVPWKPERYRDTYAERVADLVEAKRKDADFVPGTPAEPAGEVVDLMEALRASLEAARPKRKPAAKSSRNKAS